MGATFIFLIFLAGVGALVTLHQVQRKIKNQIELDQFTGLITIQLRASIITVEDSEKRLRIAHSAMIAGCAYPPSCPAFRQAYQFQRKIEEGIQEIAEQNWNAQKMKWLMHLPLLSSKNELPPFHRFKGQEELILTIRSGSLVSSSKLRKSGGKGSNGWKIAWIQ